MKRLTLCILVCLIAAQANAQPNCEIYPEGSDCRKGCEYAIKGIHFPQGSRQSQLYMDSAIAICPEFPYAWSEKSVPYLKRGDYATWWKLLSKAVELAPEEYLGYRASCLFFGLRDYKKALTDIERLNVLMGDHHGYSASGTYDIRIIKALCKKELGDTLGAMQDFDECIADLEKQNMVGFYDYLLRGLLKMDMGNYKEAEEDFEKQIEIYEALAETYYYLGVLYEKTDQQEKARQYFEIAHEKYTKTGFNMQNNQYDIQPGQITLKDIEEKLGN